MSLYYNQCLLIKTKCLCIYGLCSQTYCIIITFNFPLISCRHRALLDFTYIDGILLYLTAVIIRNDYLKVELERLVDSSQVQEEIYSVIYSQNPPESPADEEELNVYFFDEDGAIVSDLKHEWWEEDDSSDDEDEDMTPATPLMIAQMAKIPARKRHISMEY